METPPRAWGRLHFHLVRAGEYGNTPTGVGKTVRPRFRRCLSRKHPHGRGEDFLIFGHTPAFLETPPRAWGRPSAVHLHSAQIGNTPTGYVPEDSAPNLKAEYGTLTYLDTANTAWQLEQCEGEEYTYLLTLKLKELHILPSTGGTGTVPFTLAGAALMAVAVLLPGRKKVK